MPSSAVVWLRSIFAATQDRDGGRVARTPEEIQRMLLDESGGHGAVVNEGRAMRVAAVYACVRLLSDSIAMLPVNLYERSDGKHRVAESDPVNLLLSVAPNSWQTPHEFFRMAMMHLLLRGNFYAQKVVSGTRIVALLPLNPARMHVTQSTSGEVEYKYQLERGAFTVFSRKDILHLRNLSVDGLQGLSVIEAARNAIGLALDVEAHGSNLFRNGARPSGVLQHPATLSQEAVDRLRDDFDNRYSGVANAHRPMVLEEGLSWNAMQMTAEDSQFIDSRKFSRSEIAMFFGVPPHAIGDVERGTSWGSGIEQQNLGYLVYTLSPHVNNISQAMLRDLVPANDRQKFVVRFDTSVLTRADFLARQNGLQVMLKNGVISQNDWRKIEALDPIEGQGADSYRREGPAAQPAQSAPVP